MLQRALVWRQDGSFTFSDGKSAKSRRRISITPQLCATLSAHRKRQAEERLAIGSSWIDLDLVFPTECGTPQRIENLTRRHYKPLLKAAQLPSIRLYDLRHTLATLLLRQNVNPKIVSERLGHSSVSLTLDTYSHVLPDMQGQAAEVLGKVLWSQRAVPGES
ncbi:site-specific tyrosine recombinase XerC [compost metagenome]